MCKTQPFFSIQVPVYNCEPYVSQCVESILSQSFTDYELILVDDGSTDNSGVILDQYKNLDNRVIVIHKQNGGLVSARQAAANMAGGIYSMCIDGDDWIGEGTLASIYNIVVSNNNPDIVCFGMIRSSINDQVKFPLPYRSGLYNRQEIIDEFFPMLIEDEQARYFAPSAWGKAFKTDLFRKWENAVPSAITIGEDMACTIPCVYHSESVYIAPDCFYHYRYNPESMTRRHKPFPKSYPVQLYNHIKNVIDCSEYNFSEQLCRKVCHLLFGVIYSSFYDGGSYLRTKKELLLYLDNPIFEKAISNAGFHKSFKAVMLMFSLKTKLFFPLWIYSRFR